MESHRTQVSACSANRMVVLACALSLVMGCQSNPEKPKQSNRPITRRTDASTAARSQAPADTGGCDERLQDISGLFLLYSQRNNRLPDSMDDVRQLPAAAGMDFVCPISKQPYVYDAVGFPAPSGAGRVILYDAAPTHGGMRMCVVINESGKGGALVTKVIALPESFFANRKSQ